MAGGVNKKDLAWLVNTSVSDVNFAGALERANYETVQEALAEIADKENAVTKKNKMMARLRQLSKENHDHATEAAQEMVRAESRSEELAKSEQANREKLIAECNKAIGKVQTSNMFAKFATVSSLVWLKEVKESKIYRDIPGLGTWENFCDSVGMSRQKVDEDLSNLASFGEDFLLMCQQLSIGYRDLRKLRQLTHEGCIQIEDNLVVIGNESIPLDSDHREDLQAALERVIETKDALLAEKDANLKTKERLLQDKQKLIERQARDLARYEGEAEAKGLGAEEDAFLKKCAAARISMDGFLSKFDPDLNPLPADATARMKAALMETLGYFKRVIQATCDTAGDLYGDPEMESPGWIPPNLRRVDGGKE